MKASEKLVGKVATHDTLGKVAVDSIVGSSRVMVNITVIDRGEGYNEIKERYTGVRKGNGWERGEKRDFGLKDTTHIKHLKI